MSSSILEFQPASLPATAGRAYLTATGVVSIGDCRSIPKPVQEQIVESDSDGLGCARGLRSALFLEAFLVLMIYGIWHLWHMAR